MSVPRSRGTVRRGQGTRRGWVSARFTVRTKRVVATMAFSASYGGVRLEAVLAVTPEEPANR